MNGTVDRIHEQLGNMLQRGSATHVVALTGAGVSAESGIPTFRGSEGYWRIGSENFHPQEMATNAMYRRAPREVWSWYLYRLAVCTRASPGPSHQALALLGARLEERFSLITQNVDGLHRRAGSAEERSFYVHGDIAWMRIAASAQGQQAHLARVLGVEDMCKLYPVPAPLLARRIDAIDAFGHAGPQAALPIDDEEWSALMLPSGLGLARPHVLWFDESYDDRLYRSDQALSLAARASLLLVIGSSGAASLPYHAIASASRNGATIVFVDPEATALRSAIVATSESKVFHLQSTSSEGTPRLAETILSALQ